MSRLVDAAAAAEHLGVPTSWVREQTRLGQIPVFELGRDRRYDLARLDEWIDLQVREPLGDPPSYRKHQPGASK